MTLNRWITIWTAFAVLTFPALSLADHHAAGEDAAEHGSPEAVEDAAEHHSDNAGGKAAEHRSETAAERSNAQWDEHNEGRPDKPRGHDDEDGDGDEKDKKEKKGKKDKK